MAIEAITFDLDETLLFYRESPDAVLNRCFAQTGHDPFFAFEDYMNILDQHLEAAESPLELRTAAFTSLAEESGYDPTAGREVAEQWGNAHAEAEVELYPGSKQVLEACSDVCEVGLITNGPSEAQRPKMQSTGLTNAFDVEVYAADDLRFKPDPAPFEQALQAIDAPPEATVHVGDSFEADIEGAQGVGMQSVWITNTTDTSEQPGVPRIDSIGELLDLPEFSDIS